MIDIYIAHHLIHLSCFHSPFFWSSSLLSPNSLLVVFLYLPPPRHPRSLLPSLPLSHRGFSFFIVSFPLSPSAIHSFLLPHCFSFFPPFLLSLMLLFILFPFPSYSFFYSLHKFILFFTRLCLSLTCFFSSV